MRVTINVLDSSGAKVYTVNTSSNKVLTLTDTEIQELVRNLKQMGIDYMNALLSGTRNNAGALSHVFVPILNESLSIEQSDALRDEISSARTRYTVMSGKRMNRRAVPCSNMSAQPF